jgi:hypothetical protein
MQTKEILLLILAAGAFYKLYPYCEGKQISENSEESLNTTGSHANCTTTSAHFKRRPRVQENHPDSSFQTISCRNVHYRIPKRKLNQLTSSIIVGVLSSASNAGPSRRKSIRSTWAYGRKNVVFIVAGPWDEIVEEYQRYQDLLWLDMDEIYITENSTLTFKTYTFFNVMYQQGFSFLFKTDDDSYVDLEALEMALLGLNGPPRNDYWGKCQWGKKPHRNKEIPWQKKWYISLEVYPEPMYPPYCQGAGFAVSRKFLDCAVGRNHTSLIRYMPNEDVAVGLLAERCQIEPINDDRIVIRWNSDEEEPDMTNKIVQHYVTTEKHMRGHHKSVTGVRGPILV